MDWLGFEVPAKRRMMDNTKKQKLEDFYKLVKACKTKGRLYIYEQFKRGLLELDLDPYEYEEACRTIAKYLEV